MSDKRAGAKDLEYYLNLDYPMQITRQVEDDEVYWLAEILDLPGCVSHGDTPEEAFVSINEAKRLWLEASLEQGHEIPEPSHREEFSGRLVLRMPRSLHRRLAMQAQREGVSLNQYIVSLLAGRVEKAAIQKLVKFS